MSRSGMGLAHGPTRIRPTGRDGRLDVFSGRFTRKIAAIFELNGGFCPGSGEIYPIYPYFNAQVGVALTLGLIGSTPLVPTLAKWADRWAASSGETLARPILDVATQTISVAGTCVILFTSALAMAAETYNPFIYFRF